MPPVIVLLAPHHFKGDCWRLRNLQGTFELFGYGSPGILRRRFELARRGRKAVRAGVQRINSQVAKGLVRMPVDITGDFGVGNGSEKKMGRERFLLRVIFIQGRASVQKTMPYLS